MTRSAQASLKRQYCHLWVAWNYCSAGRLCVALAIKSACECTVKRMRSIECAAFTLRSETYSGESSPSSMTRRWYEHISEPHSTGSAQCAWSAHLPIRNEQVATTMCRH